MDYDIDFSEIGKDLKRIKKHLKVLRARDSTRTRSRSRSHRSRSRHHRSRGGRSRSRSTTRSRRRVCTPPRRRRSSSRTRTPSLSPSPKSEEEDVEEKPVVVDLTSNTVNDEDMEILALLGDPPEENAQGPELPSALIPRWESILKKGLNHDKKKELMKQYPPPQNFKILDAPKLNPEAQIAAGEAVVKRDKAMEQKQKQVSSAIAALGIALSGVITQTVDKQEIIKLLSDAARLLCDHIHSETNTRKNFILSGMDKTIREAIKDVESDEWLLSKDLAEKLKACKAIKKTGEELIPNKLQTVPKNSQNAFKKKAPPPKKPHHPQQRSQKQQPHSQQQQSGQQRGQQSSQQNQRGRSQHRGHGYNPRR